MKSSGGVWWHALGRFLGRFLAAQTTVRREAQ